MNEKIESMLRWRDQLKDTPPEHNLRRTVLAVVEAVAEADADLDRSIRLLYRLSAEMVSLAQRVDSLASRVDLDGGYADSDLDVDNDCEDKVDSPPNCDHDKRCCAGVTSSKPHPPSTICGATCKGPVNDERKNRIDAALA